jgi:hypothetical protein
MGIPLTLYFCCLTNKAQIRLGDYQYYKGIDTHSTSTNLANYRFLNEYQSLYCDTINFRYYKVVFLDRYIIDKQLGSHLACTN